MHFMRRAAIWPFALVLLTTGALAADRTEVAIKQTALSNGEVRYSVPISFGGSPAIDVMLDTGSTGMRILESALPGSVVKTTDTATAIAYTSGVRLNGVVGTVPISIGTLTSPAPLNVELVKTIDCVLKQPQCPATRVRPADYRIGGDGLSKQGFGAIIGIGSNAADLDNPLTQMGVHSWVVVLPQPGSKSPGKLILNPDPNDVAEFEMFPMQVTFRPDAPIRDAIPGCLVIKATRRICGPTLLDTGAPGIAISASTQADSAGWTRGDQMSIAFTDRKGNWLSVDFTADQGRPSTISASQPAGLPITHISAGTLPFFSFSVLYDQDTDLIGLKRR